MNKLHKVEFEMLLELKRICEKNGLTYYLSGGTFLGAVRHKGFIPWDDDIDVAMPREDYERFTDVVAGELPEKMSFKTYKLDKTHRNPVARIVNNEVLVKNYSYSNPKVEPAWIDVFPLDGIPNSRLLTTIHKVHLLWRKVMIGWVNHEYIQDAKEHRKWYEKLLISVGNKMKLSKYFDITKQYSKLEDVLKKYPSGKSRFYFNFNGVYRFNSIMEKEVYYGDGDTYIFEGVEFNAPKNYHAYLSKIYGTYMDFPPENKRNLHKTEMIE